MESTERVDQAAAPDDDAPHLLVVDDDTRIRNLLKQYLTENGFRVTVAGNADEARRKLAGLDF
ncbi:MAG: response regulator, partial [Mesorhizobium sp.]